MKRTYDVAAYVWPSYTGDEPRTRMFWPEGNGEWETVRKAGPKFPGHTWPRRPLWGYCNEADPRVMEMQIDAAADHGVNVFIYDWYWYDRRPFLEQCLNNGYLKARNNERVKFYLMWANHDVLSLWDIRLAHVRDGNVIWQAAVDRPEFERLTDRLIGSYFRQPNYYTIDGRPVFMIYDQQNLLKGLGGVAATREVLDGFRQRAVEAGLPGLHLQMCTYRKTFDFSGVDGGRQVTSKELVDLLGFDSLSHYQYVHFTNIDRDYGDILPDVVAEWERIDREYAVPYFPHVSMGWDNNPRFQTFRPGVVKNATPEAIEKAFRAARAYVDAHPQQPPLITVNSWNEWTETSYLEPDDLYGYGYLEAARKVFLEEPARSGQ
ncbi:MAG: glycoside hydrolase family 99-like domain-containing protein [Lentisphaeria bacterium]|nr:glycoside hydrolase family 99-like domain-containing protein [Lentisphaeria bacterium]